MFYPRLKTPYSLFISLLAVVILLSCGQSRPLSEFDSADGGSADKATKPPRQEVYFEENTMRMEDRRYNDRIYSDQLYPQNDPLAAPLISLTNGPALELHFDEIGSDREDYFYRIYHCNADWSRSDLLETEYIEGFFSNTITDNRFSFGPLRQYVHYKATFPNSGLRLTRSGNYVVAVLRDDNEDEVVLTKRFMIVDERLAIIPDVRQSAVVQERQHKQLVDFEIHHASFDIADPFRDLKTVVLQNNRWDNAKVGLTPIFIRDRVLTYRYENGNDFWGGNEFRSFNFSSVRFASEEIAKISQQDDNWSVRLTPDFKRNIGNYTSLQDANGAYVIRNADGFDDELESEYADVRFELSLPAPLNTGSVYVFGALSNYRAEERFKMSYSPEIKGYELTVPLKQGYYEYLYMVGSDYSQALDPLPIEGSHFETDNNYTILVYYRDIRNDYDELIGSRTFSALDFF